MGQEKAPASPKQGEKGNPPLRRGQIRNRIIKDFFRSLAALASPGQKNQGVGSGTTTPSSSSAYNSDGSPDA